MDATRIEYLFMQYSNDVHKFLVYFTRSRDVDDLVQDTFLKAIKGLSEMRGENARAWIISIARNVAVDHLRKAKRSVPVDHDTLKQLPSLAKAPDEWAELRDEQKHLLRKLQSMKRSYREVVICRAFMDMTPGEAASALGWSRNRVDVTLHRAIKNLRALMTEELGGEVNDLAKGR